MVDEAICDQPRRQPTRWRNRAVLLLGFLMLAGCAPQSATPHALPDNGNAHGGGGESGGGGGGSGM